MVSVFLCIVLELTAAVLAVRLSALARSRTPWLLVAGALFALLFVQSYLLLAAGRYIAVSTASGLGMLLFAALLLAGLVVMTRAAIADEKAEVLGHTSEAQFHLLAESIGDGICLLDQGGITSFANRRMAAMLGYSPTEMVGRRYSHFLADSDDAPVVTPDRTGTQGTQLRMVEFLHRDGHRVRARLSTGPLAGAQGWSAGALAIATDLTAERLTTATFAEMEARFDLFARQSAEVCWSAGPDGERSIHGAAAFEATWGRQARAFHRSWDRWLEAVHHADQDLASQAWNKFLASPGTETYDTEYRITRPDGSIRWIHDRAEPIRDAAGAVIRLCGIAGDITERKRAADQLRALIEGAPVPLVLVDSAGVIRLGNARLERLFGYGRGALSGRPLATLLPGGLREKTDLMGVRANGEKISIEAGVDRIPTADGTLTLGFITDLSERKQLTREQEELQDRLVESQRLESMGVLAGGVAHDLNNLLTLVLCNAQMARADVTPGGDLAATLLQIEHATIRASDLTSQMLAYAGRGELVVGPVDLSAVVAESTPLLKAALPSAAVLRIDPGASLPAIEADPGQVRQILVSLVTNAGEALNDGHGTVTVRTGSFIADKAYLRSTVLPDDGMDGPYGFLEIEDDGCGMSEALQQRVFEPFFSTRPGGRGLGLAAALGIIRRQRGTIRVDSRTERGTTIRVLFPLAGHGEENGRAATGREGTVLLVDDEQDVLRLISRFLGREGFGVRAAASGEEALGLFKRYGEEIDAVVLDLTMPGMSGEELLAAIRAANPEVPVIVTSGYSEAEVTHRCRGLPFSAFLPKPYLPAEVVSELHRTITAARPRRAGSRVPV